MVLGGYFLTVNNTLIKTELPLHKKLRGGNRIGKASLDAEPNLGRSKTKDGGK
jgi:hypothetical protein